VKYAHYSLSLRRAAPDNLDGPDNWQKHGACRDEDPDLFFPQGNTGIFLAQIEEARQVCRRCPVMEACGNWALATGQDAGVWGGLSEEERRSMKRRAARARTAAKQ
jgi:WhiB family redox-sensing transcriptional regulator